MGHFEVDYRGLGVHCHTVSVLKTTKQQLIFIDDLRTTHGSGGVPKPYHV